MEECIVNSIKSGDKYINKDTKKALLARYRKGILTIPEMCKQLATDILSKNIGDEEAEKLGSYYMLKGIRFQTPDSFSKCVTRLYENVDPTKKPKPLVTKEFYERVLKNQLTYDMVAENASNSEQELTLFALSTLERAYLLKDSIGLVERPVYMYLRVAIVTTSTLEESLDMFKILVNRKATFATPVMFNAGCAKNPSLASCFLYAMTPEKDSIDGIFSSLHDCAKISHMSGGIGISFHDIRARGSPINGGAGKANGIIPVMQLFNTMAKTVDQGGGRRRGSIAVYLETHHPDLIEFLEARQTYGNQELRTHDLFTAVWVSDLFMKRVEENGTWSFFCPELCPGLSNCYGDDYEKLYLEYEDLGLESKKMPAREVFYKIVDTQMNASLPYLLFKDSCNKKSNQKNIGTIRSSNLCAEVVQYSDETQTAVCNLASICLPTFIDTENNFNFAELHKVTYTMAFHLDSLIDKTHYPIESAQKSNKSHRPIGIGTQGLADCLCKMKLSWGTQKALDLDEKIHATIYHAALSASSDLAKKNGPYSSFVGSPASMGILQYDLWNSEPIDISPFSWDSLKDKIKEFGLRNSLSVALMPTASTAQIAGNSESIEPYNAMIFTRGTLAGEYVVVNNELRKTLKSKDSWNEKVVNNIIANHGSIQYLPESILSKKEKSIFKTAWEIKQKDLLIHASRRGKYNCQSMSLNVFMKNPTRQKLTSLHFASWKLGLKTSTYYIRMTSPASAIQFSLDSENTACESCSA